MFRKWQTTLGDFFVTPFRDCITLFFIEMLNGLSFHKKFKDVIIKLDMPGYNFFIAACDAKS